MSEVKQPKLDREEFDRLLEGIERAKLAREKMMPDEASAIDLMHQCYLRLKELGYNDAVYCPKDGSIFKAIEAGSSGIHDCSYDGEWPSGSWYVHAYDDLWPTRPILFKKADV